jgi:succinylarginine dihydrolase
MITIKNTESIEAITSVNGIEVDNVILADGNPNVRILDIALVKNDVVKCNDFEVVFIGEIIIFEL